MRKQEFLQALRRALTGDVPPGVVEENIRYYDGYIAEEVRRGRTEEEVIREIGDPRLIARTIEDTTDGAGDSRFRSGGAYEYDQSGPWGQGEDEYRQDPLRMDVPFHVFRLDKWYWKLLLALIVVGVIYLVITIIGGLFSLIAPFIGPLLVIWLLVSIFRKNGKW
ncbi:MAG: DUF1700 domain-containing protein [Hungatella sp.]|nr:DUF1700 domain-containing protein [Hungatella sp.]